MVRIVNATVDVRAALVSQYLVAPELLPFILGTVIRPATLTLEWHEEVSSPGTYTATLTGKAPGAGSWSGTGTILLLTDHC